jgi:hypothetical protein
VRPRRVEVHRVRLISAGLAVALLATACASQPTTPPAVTVCTAHAQLQQSWEAFQALDPQTAQPGDYQSAWFAVRQDFLELRDYRYELADANVTAVNDAIEDLRRAVDALPDDVSVPDAIDSLEPELSGVRSAFSGVKDELNGPSLEVAPCDDPGNGVGGDRCP